MSQHCCTRQFNTERRVDLCVQCVLEARYLCASCLLSSFSGVVWGSGSVCCLSFVPQRDAAEEGLRAVAQGMSLGGRVDAGQENRYVEALALLAAGAWVGFESSRADTSGA